MLSVQNFVVHCKKTKQYDIYIGRPTIWGNPFILKSETERVNCVKKYRDWLFAPEQAELLAKAKIELKGKVLACWCSPKLCHGHVLAAVVNEMNFDILE